MATFEFSPDLDPSVAQAIQQAMDALRAELVERLAPTEPASSTLPRVGNDEGDRLQQLERAVEALDGADNQAELLGALLRQAGSFAERTLFLVLENEVLKGWAAYGFGETLDVTQVELAIPAEIESRQPSADPQVCADLCSQMGAAPATEGLIIPFALRGRVVGVLYADRSAGAAQIDPPALRILTYVAAQVLETLPLRRPRDAAAAKAATALEAPPPAPAASEAEDILAVHRGVADTPTEKPGEETATEVETAEEAPSAEETTEEAVVAGETTEEIAEVAADRDIDATTDGEDVEVIETADKAFATQEISTVEMPLEEESVATVIQEMPPRQLEDAEVVPPGDLEGPGWAFGGKSQDGSDDFRDEEAKRLARLLVTEIKLYNEEKVREGRENSDIYEQLRDDIERSRRIYHERIDEKLRTQTDYFQEEVVRILAGGDSTALGA